MITRAHKQSNDKYTHLIENEKQFEYNRKTITNLELSSSALSDRRFRRGST